jgi:hypothetical protein
MPWVDDDSVDDQDSVAQQKCKDDRQQEPDRIAHATHIQRDQNQHQANLYGELVGLGACRQDAEQTVGAASERNRDRQHVIDH